MSKTLSDGQARVYNILGTNEAKSAGGQYGATQVTAQLNTAQRFVVKAAIPAALGTLVKRSTHTASAAAPYTVTKQNNGEGRTIALMVGTGLTDAIPIVSAEEWANGRKCEEYTSSDLQSYVAMEMGSTFYIRPDFTVSTVVTEFYVDDPTDMSASTDCFSLPDDWFEWVCLLAAMMLCINSRDWEKLHEIQAMAQGWSTAFKAQWGMNPPTFQAPAEAGKAV